MAGFQNNTPGGLWMNVGSKAFSYGFAKVDGFGGSMHAIALAGGIRNHLLYHHSPMICAVPKPENAAYLSGGGTWGDTIKNVLRKVMHGANVAHQAGVTKAAANLIERAVGGPAAPMPMERGESAPGVRNADLTSGAPPRKRTAYGGGRHGGAFF